MFIISIVHFTKLCRHAQKQPWVDGYFKMATRKRLNKLNVSFLWQLPEKQGLNVQKAKKEELITSILTNQVDKRFLTPIRAE